MHRFLVRVVFNSIRNLEKFMVDMRNKAGHTVNLRNPTPFPSMWLQEKQIQWNLEDIILISQEKRWVLSGYLYCWQEKRSPTKFESGFSGGSEPPSSPDKLHGISNSVKLKAREIWSATPGRRPSQAPRRSKWFASLVCEGRLLAQPRKKHWGCQYPNRCMCWRKPHAWLSRI